MAASSTRPRFCLMSLRDYAIRPDRISLIPTELICPAAASESSCLGTNPTEQSQQPADRNQLANFIFHRVNPPAVKVGHFYAENRLVPRSGCVKYILQQRKRTVKDVQGVLHHSQRQRQPTSTCRKSRKACSPPSIQSRNSCEGLQV